MHACMCVWVHICMHACMYVYTYICSRPPPPPDPAEPAFCKQSIMAVGIFAGCENIARLKFHQGLYSVKCENIATLEFPQNS